MVTQTSGGRQTMFDQARESSPRYGHIPVSAIVAVTSQTPILLLTDSEFTTGARFPNCESGIPVVRITIICYA